MIKLSSTAMFRNLISKGYSLENASRGEAMLRRASGTQGNLMFPQAKSLLKQKVEHLANLPVNVARKMERSGGNIKAGPVGYLPDKPANIKVTELKKMPGIPKTPGIPSNAPRLTKTAQSVELMRKLGISAANRVIASGAGKFPDSSSAIYALHPKTRHILFSAPMDEQIAFHEGVDRVKSRLLAGFKKA